MGASGPADNFRYAHGRSDVVWMSQNTNELARSEAARRAILEALDRGLDAFYPLKRGLPGLADGILSDLGLSPAEHGVLLTHGATEAHYVLHRATLAPLDEVIGHDPSFMPIHAHVRLSGAKVVELPIYADPWKMTADRVAAALTPRTRSILLIDPINPLGTGYRPDEVRAIAEVARDRGLLLVHDVAYRDFSREPALATRFYPENTVVTYTFSKSFGLAGMRLGALVAPKALLPRFEPFQVANLSVNILGQTAALALLRDKAVWLPSVLRTCRENQEVIRKAVQRTPGTFLPVFPSDANHFVIDISATGVDPARIEDKLLRDHGVFVRGGAYVSPTFGKNFVRVSFSVPPAGVQRFAEAFPKTIEALRAS